MSSSSHGGIAGIRKQIRGQLFKMSIVMVLMTVLVVFARDFVMSGLMAKLYLNGTIFLVFFYGIFMAFRTVLSLKNDEMAFAALVETYDDFKVNEAKAKTDPYWRHYKCLEPAQVYTRPRILGHFYEIVFEELLRTRKMRMSVPTMQSLVHGVEQRLAEERSLVLYLSGLLVFMGLIGAFIGLMQMVSSVGTIVGSLGGGGGADMFTRLIGDLQGPLKGMSVGFSSSLFGLTGSLILGLMARLSNHAAMVLKVEFEGWLANVAQIEEDGDQPQTAANIAPVAAAIGMDGEKAKLANRALESMAKSMSRSVELLETIVEAQKAQGSLLSRTANGIDQLAIRQGELQAGIATLSGAVTGVMSDGFRETGRILETATAAQASAVAQLSSQQATIASSLGAMANRQSAAPEDLRRVAQAVEAGMSRGFNDIARVIEAGANTQSTQISELIEAQARTVVAPVVQVPATPAVDIARLGQAIEVGLVRGLGEVAKTVDASARRTAQGLETFAAAQDRADIAGVRAELANLSQVMESGLRDGLVEMSRNIEQAFLSYAELVRQMQHNAGFHAAPVAPPQPAAEPEEHKVTIIGDDAARQFNDHQEMMQRLISTAAKTLKPAASA